jgi:uncharacterized low-complexity protein
MSNKQVVKPIALAVGIALAGPFAAVEVASADTVESPFVMTVLSAPYMLGESEGSCGGDKVEDKDKGGEGSCGEDKVEDKDKGGEGSCGGDKVEDKDKGGEGKCGGSM